MRAKCTSKKRSRHPPGRAPTSPSGNCYFHDNQDGILANAVVGSSILIEYSEFYKNGAGDGQSHNMYINGVGLLYAALLLEPPSQQGPRSQEPSEG